MSRLEELLAMIRRPRIPHDTGRVEQRRAVADRAYNKDAGSIFSNGVKGGDY